MATYTLSPFFSHRVATNRLAPEVLAILPERYKVGKQGLNGSFFVAEKDAFLDTLLVFTSGYPHERARYAFPHNGDRFVVEGFGFDDCALPRAETNALLAVLCMMCTLQHTIENPKAAAPAQAAEPTQSFVDRALAVFGLKRI